MTSIDDMSEHELADMATFAEDELDAALAMYVLQEKFDPTYGWCYDCDGLAVKKPHICWEDVSPKP